MNTTDDTHAENRGQESRVLSGLDAGRAAFEAWFSEGGKWPAAVRRNGDGYMLAAAQSAWNAYKAAWDCQQAEIDRLMLEYCPDELTQSQMAAWVKAQVPGHDIAPAVFDAALKP